VVRPYDGEVPQRIAFVQCLDDQDTHSFLYTAKETLISQRKVERLQANLFFPGQGTTQREVEKHFGKRSGVTLQHKKVLGIKEIEGSRNLAVQSTEKGKTKEEEFELVVLLTGLELLPESRELNRKLGLEIRRFLETSDTSPVETSKTGVFLAGWALID